MDEISLKAFTNALKYLRKASLERGQRLRDKARDSDAEMWEYMGDYDDGMAEGFEMALRLLEKTIEVLEV
ncbi:hypothetical protein SEA_DUBLIN_84 [Mycobacterium phage Dublin]|nr:hypothetical protein SEA_DUBLIN_84 [Mycobacterium phage Dublin]QGJ92257.1 hypothetical protein SEA_MARYSWELL_85 [Mycobacterium phage MarysWell]